MLFTTLQLHLLYNIIRNIPIQIQLVQFLRRPLDSTACPTGSPSSIHERQSTSGRTWRRQRGNDVNGVCWSHDLVNIGGRPHEEFALRRSHHSLTLCQHPPSSVNPLTPNPRLRRAVSRYPLLSCPPVPQLAIR